jgi:hypothetical protein
MFHNIKTPICPYCHSTEYVQYEVKNYWRYVECVCTACLIKWDINSFINTTTLQNEDYERITGERKNND